MLSAAGAYEPQDPEEAFARGFDKPDVRVAESNHSWRHYKDI